MRKMGIEGKFYEVPVLSLIHILKEKSQCGTFSNIYF
jgi:hypothetical protein